VRFVAIVKESLPGEVEAFTRGAWGGEVLLDQKMAWFAALGGGCVNQMTLTGFVGKLANPWSKLRANFKALKTKSSDGNFKGEGLITGGLYVVAPGGAAAYTFLEEEVGDMFDLDEVVGAARRAAGAQQPARAEQQTGWDSKSS
jgi:hypothetical protein